MVLHGTLRCQDTYFMVNRCTLQSHGTLWYFTVLYVLEELYCTSRYCAASWNYMVLHGTLRSHATARIVSCMFTKYLTLPKLELLYAFIRLPINCSNTVNSKVKCTIFS